MILFLRKRHIFAKTERGVSQKMVKEPAIAIEPDVCLAATGEQTQPTPSSTSGPAMTREGGKCSEVAFA